MTVGSAAAGTCDVPCVCEGGSKRCSYNSGNRRAAAVGSLVGRERYVKLPVGNTTALGRVEVGMRVVSTSGNCYCCEKCAGVGER